MIDFRYHLVSIIAVFLALAVGIVVGSTALQPAVESSLHKAETLLRRQIDRVTQQNTTLNEQLGANQAFARAAEKRLVGHLLTGQSVILVTAPSPDSSVVNGVTGAIKEAGASVTGTVALQPQFFDSGDSTEAKLTQLAQTLAGGNGLAIAAPADGSTITGQQAAARIIAAAVVSKDSPPVLSPAQDQAILAGFAAGGYLHISGPRGNTASSLPPASLAVVVAPSAPASSADGNTASLGLLAVAEQLQAASHGTVLAGSLAGSGPGSAVDQASGSDKVSTVDVADSVTGQVITVQALSVLLSGRAPSSYGVRPGAVPSPAPTPPASPSPTTSATTHARRK